MSLAIVLGMAALVMPAEVAEDDPVKKELELLQGRWEMVERVVRGKKATADEMKRLKGVMLIEGNKKTGWSDESGKKVDVQETTIKIDPTANPKTVDKTIVKGTGEGETTLGIYKLDGDQLTICLAVGTKERPTEFSAKPAVHHLVLVYKRVKK